MKCNFLPDFSSRDLSISSTPIEVISFTVNPVFLRMLRCISIRHGNDGIHYTVRTTHAVCKENLDRVERLLTGAHISQRMGDSSQRVRQQISAVERRLRRKRGRPLKKR